MAVGARPPMKLEHLTLTNFRGFHSLEISFDPAFTVLLGGNMAGKSAVLDATAVETSTTMRSASWSSMSLECLIFSSNHPSRSPPERK